MQRLRKIVAHYSIHLLAIVLLAIYVRVTIWRPDLSGLMPLVGGVFYLSWNNVLSVAVVGIVLVMVTRNVLFSLLVGATATLIWTPVDLCFWGLITGHDFGTYFHWWLFALYLLVAVSYYTKSVGIVKIHGHIIIISFLVFISMYILLFFFHELMAPFWLEAIRTGAGGVGSPTLVEIVEGTIQKISGYLFYSFGIICVSRKISQKLEGNWHLVLSFLVLLSVTVVRVIYSLRSGFILPDEALFYTIIPNFMENGRLLFSHYTYPMFQLLVLGVGILFNIDNVWKFMSVFPFFSFLFSFGTIFLVWKITGNKCLAMASALTISVFVGAATMLTEIPTLFFVVLGIYFTARKRAFYSALSFSVAILFREHYVIFLIGNLILNRQEWKKYLLGCLPALAVVYLGQIITRFSLNIPTSPSIFERFSFTFVNSAIGLLFSLTPFLGVLTLYFVFKKRSERGILWWNGVFAFGGLLILNFFILRDLYYVANVGKYSALMRFACIAFPSILVLRRFHRRRLLCSALSLLIIAPLMPFVVQSNLSVESVNRFSLNYKAPWWRLAGEVKQENVIIYAEPVIRAGLFVSNATVSYPPKDESEFCSAVKNFERIYFYGEKYVYHEEALQDEFLWYYHLVESRQNVTEIWDDGESYLLRWDG